ncbi:CopD family protein [Flavisphingomonas formosensis]|uniref:CopD family protein n=1 Tax=Flavisphingomonas formosensis TaxID=861534 RepID=UPI0012F7571D|nr:CopD family protein [Sphingomonas formosensis]
MTALVGFLGAAYPWVKAAHLIFVIFWIAGLFMLPRFYIYHQPVAPGSVEDRQWIERESRLRRIIITPAMALVWIFGLMLATDQGLWDQHWFQAKLACVLALSGYHGWAVGYGKKLASGFRPPSDRALRMMNEIPGIATAVVVILVIVRPF